jgi:TIR domain
MNVLLSWSKDQSKAIASAFYKWLPTVVPGIEPWMSSEDISKGLKWSHELHGELEDTRICIICLTPENVRSPWIYYEAGAISTNGSDVLIYPYLLGMSPNMLADGPLIQWQCTVATRDDTWELIKSLNTHALDSKHDVTLLEGKFKAHWPDFEAQLQPLLEVESEDAEEFIATDADCLAGVNLTTEARTMVLEVSKDNGGMLSYSSTDGDTSFDTHCQNLCLDQSPRTVAKWKAALDNLVEYNILEPRGYENVVFALTAKGFDIAEALEGET